MLVQMSCPAKIKMKTTPMTLSEAEMLAKQYDYEVLEKETLNVIKIGVAQGWPQEEVLKYAHAINLVLCLKMGMEERQRQWEKVFK